MTLAGAEMQIFYLARELRRRGWRVGVISMLPPEALVKQLEDEGIRFASLEMRRKFPDPRKLFKLAALLREWQPGILHCHMVHANLMGRLVRLLTPLPVVVSTAHNINEGGRLRELLYRITDPLTDITTQISRIAMEHYIRIGAVPADRIRFIPNGLDLERFRPDPELRREIREQLQLPGEFIWLAVGRFDEAKDYPNMLHAFAKATAARSGVLLLVGGDGLEEEMAPLARELGIGESVRFLGIRDDVQQLMKGVDGYLMSSAWEGMPMVLLEAAASALPIVTTDVGGNREVVRDGVSGFVVEPGDANRLASAIQRMMALPEEQRRAMGEAGRKLVEKHYGLAPIMEQWEALYAELGKRSISGH
ncbi:MAG TPA: glycosyltransferase [Gammaproteobacteria bacterium]|nr:glycosyltransferase [Gammaproteobacteria bacterium]